jgi:hypothetical protein
VISLAFVVVEVAIQIIWKEEYPKHCKHNKKFYQNYNPERFTYSHASKSIAVESI